MESTALYVISVAARLADMHPQTLRIYERKGLLKPSRSPGRTRLYSEEDIRRLREIQYLTDLGVNLAGVRMVFELRDQLDEAAGRLEEMQSQLLRQRQVLEAELVRILRRYSPQIVHSRGVSLVPRRIGNR